MSLDPSWITAVTQGGLAAVGVFGLYHGYSLYAQQINAPPPESKMAQSEYARRHMSIKYFLATSLIVALLSGGIEIAKFIHSSKNEITIKISNYDQLSDAIKPKLNLRKNPLIIETFGTTETIVGDKDAIYVEIGALVAQLETYKRSHEEAIKQITSQSNGEIGHDDPN